MIKIKAKYIGPKPSETDCVAGTGLTWLPDQVHEVPEKAWAIMAKHPDVWENVGVIEMAPVADGPVASVLAAMTLTDANSVSVELVKTEDGVMALPDGVVFAQPGKQPTVPLSAVADFVQSLLHARRIDAADVPVICETFKIDPALIEVPAAEAPPPAAGDAPPADGLPDGAAAAGATGGADNTDIDEIAALRKQVEAAGGTVDKRWKEPRLREELAALTKAKA